MFFRRRRLHFVGIGGIGMSGIAEVLLNLGCRISGSDRKLTPITERLAALGARIHEGHDAGHVGDADAVVVSSAVDAANPEVAEARHRQIPVIPRGELLAELMRLKYGVAVAGSHGKTTTTSMIASILSHGGLDPTVVVGGRVGAMGSNARVGKSDFLVVESDESDGSFLKLAPILAIVTNIDREHMDHYVTMESLLASFTGFVNRVPFYGAAIVCLDDENVQRILPSVTRRVITYGMSAQAQVQVAEIRHEGASSRFHLRRRDEDLGCFRLNVPGAHNVLNAAAAVTAGLELDMTVETVRQGLEVFQGVDRRFQVRGSEAGVTVVDDYGHHPTEIRATLAAARLQGHRRVVALFQPHRYTRTQLLLDDFAASFHAADVVFVLDIYAASEQPIEGVTAAGLVDRMRAFGHRGVYHAPAIDDAVEAALAEVHTGDLLITLGAGNIWQAGDLLLKRLAERS